MSIRIPSRPGTSHARRGREPANTPVVSKRIATLLLAELKRLEEIRAAMTIEGFDAEAASLATTVADLQWQYEELEGRWSDGSSDETSESKIREERS